MSVKFLFTCLASFIFSLSLAVQADECEDLDSRSQSKLSPGDIRRLRELARTKDPELYLRALVLLARSEQQGGHPDQALLRLKEFADPSGKNLEYPRCLGLAEYARICASVKGQEGIARSIQTALRKAAPPGPSLVAELLGDQELHKQRSAEAIRAWEDAIATAQKVLDDHKKSEYPTACLQPDEVECQRILRRCKAKLSREREADEMLKAGEDAILYRRARQVHAAAEIPPGEPSPPILWAYLRRDPEDLSADLTKARLLYADLVKRFPGTQVAESAKFQALVAWPLDEIGAKQLSALEDYIRQNPAGLHTGEAHLSLGHFYTLASFDHERADKAWNAGLAWLLKIRRNDPLKPIPKAPLEGAAFTKPQEQFFAENDCRYQFFQAEKAPGEVLNRYSAPWYLDWLELELRYRLAFSGVRRKNWDEANQQLEAILSLSSGESAQVTPSIRLRGILDPKDPGIYPYRKWETMNLAPKHLAALQYSSFLACTLHKSLALPAATYLRRYAAKHKIPSVEVYAAINQVCGMLVPDRAAPGAPFEELFADILTKYENSKIPQMAMIYLNMSYNESDEERRFRNSKKALTYHLEDDDGTLEICRSIFMSLIYQPDRIKSESDKLEYLFKNDQRLQDLRDIRDDFMRHRLSNEK